MSDNMKLWQSVCAPPKEALKPIKGGRLSGMTDINPQWRYRAMTEVYGPCGEGWSYNIDKLWTEQGTEGQVFAFALVSVTVGEGKPIQGCGGSMLIAKERNGLHCSDEAFKMAITDALSTSLKMLGVGADIYEGLFDGKHSKSPAKAPPKKDPPKKENSGKPTAEDIKYFQAMADQKKRLGDEAYYKLLKSRGLEHCNELTSRETRTALYTALAAI